MKISNKLLGKRKDNRIQLEMLRSSSLVDIHKIFYSKQNKKNNNKQLLIKVYF
jgi:hypothetical protein